MEFLPSSRIISDLHIGHPASLIKDPEQLIPLFRDIPRVIFNGDTVEMRLKWQRESGQRHLERLAAVCQAAGADPCFINGNHDPAASGISHLDLADGQILITHGDMLFHDIAPWSREAPFLRAAHEKALSDLHPDALLDFEQRLGATKKAALALEMHNLYLPRGRFARFAAVLRECWPPWRPLFIIKCWFDTPREAVKLARTFRPDARFVLLGHTHYSGCWRRDNLMIINTGSFMPVSGCYAVDLEERKLTVRRVERRGRTFHLGRLLASYELAPITWA